MLHVSEASPLNETNREQFISHGRDLHVILTDDKPPSRIDW